MPGAMGAPPPRPSPPKPAGPPPIPQYTPSQPLPPKPQMPGALNVAPPAPAAPAVPGLLQPTPLAPPAPAPQPTGAVDLFGLPVAAPPPAPPVAPAPPPIARQKSNDWPAPSGVDPAVWAQLPEAMQREILMQRGGDPHADSATAAVPPPRAPRASGADAYRSQKHSEAPAHSTHGVVQIECLARCSLRTLKT